MDAARNIVVHDLESVSVGKSHLKLGVFDAPLNVFSSSRSFVGAEPAFELVEVRRKNEDRERLGALLHNSQRALNVDLENSDIAPCEKFFNLGDRRGIPVSVNQFGFKKGSLLKTMLKLVKRKKVVIDAVDFLFTFWTSRAGDDADDARIGGHPSIENCVLSDTAWP